MKNLISLDDVCRKANCSRPTIYRRLKTTDFPKPQKVAATEDRGPRTVHRWDGDQVVAWLKKEEKRIKARDKAREKEAWLQKEKWIVKEEWAEKERAGTEKPETLVIWYKKNEFIIHALVGGLLAGLAVQFLGTR